MKMAKLINFQISKSPKGQSFSNLEEYQQIEILIFSRFWKTWSQNVEIFTLYLEMSKHVDWKI